VQNKPVEAYKRVLTAVDFSTCSRKALQTAIQIAPGAVMSAAHIYDFPFPVIMGLSSEQEESIKEDMLLTVRQDAAADMKHFLAPFGDGIVEILERGDVRHKLAELVGRIQPDLLAIGTHERSGFMTALIGSVALSFLNDPPCDILITKGY
jgi:nucleotide-binding universal stress UspA family protein